MSEVNTRCPHCKRSLPPESRFCPRCGLSTSDDSKRNQATAQEPPFLQELVDKAWDFFASTRNATVMIIVLALFSIGGSLIEQESLYQDWRPPYLYYPFRYGPFWGNLWMKLGLTHAYSSVWYLGLIWLLVISLIVCSLHRLIPLHRVLTRPQTKKAEHFVRRQPLAFAKPNSPGGLDELDSKLRQRGFRIWRHETGLHADRGRLGRYGPYIIHIGLILVAVAATLKVLPGWDVTKDAWIADGETASFQGLDWQVKSDQFHLELYPNGMPKRYASDLEIIDHGKTVKTGYTEVNHALNYQLYDIYQAAFRREYGTATFDVKVGSGDQAVSVGSFTMDLRQPQASYTITPNLKVAVRAYYNDFTFDAQGVPGNASPDVAHPVIFAELLDAKDQSLSRVSADFAPMGRNPTPGEQIAPPQIQAAGPITLSLKEYKVRWYTGLRMHKDLTIPYFFSGLAIVLLGLVITFFVFHQQVWVLEVGDQLLVGARTNKNTYTLGVYLKRLLGVEPLTGQDKPKATALGPLDIAREATE